MKGRSTLALALALAALCGIYAGKQWLSKEKVRQVEEAKKLFSFAPGAVQSLSIKQVGEAPSVGKRMDADAWEITAPNPTIPPFHYMWNRVAEKLSELKNETTLAVSNPDLAQYGLADPALLLKAEVEGTAPLELRFGFLEPTQMYRYAQQDAGPVFLVKKDSYFELDRSMDDLRQRYLVNDREADLLRFEFVRIWTGRDNDKMEDPPAVGTESVAVAFARASKDAPWKLESPIAAPADQERAKQLVDEIQFAVGYNFVDNPENLTDYGLNPPRFRITVADAKDGKPQTILLGDVDQSGAKEKNKSDAKSQKKNPDKKEDATAGGALFAKRADRDAVFLMDPQILTLFPHTPDGLRERRLFMGSAKELTRIEATVKGEHFALVKDAGGWKIEPATTDPLDQQAVSIFIGQLKETEAESFLDGAPAHYGLDSPEARFVLCFGEERQEIRLAPNPADPAFYYATQDSGTVVRLNERSAAELMRGSAQFHSRELLRFIAVDANNIEFSLDGTHYVLIKLHNKWLVQLPERKKLGNQSDAEKVLDALTPLSAKGAVDVPESNLAAYGLDAPVLTVSVATQAGENEPVVAHGPLKVGGVAPDDSQKRYANVAGRDGVFFIGQEVVDAFRELLSGLKDEVEQPAAAPGAAPIPADVPTAPLALQNTAPQSPAAPNTGAL